MTRLSLIAAWTLFALACSQEPAPQECVNDLVPGCEDAFAPLCDLEDPGCGYREAGLCREGPATDLFMRRIQPLITEDRPGSCNACHLSGINLQLFVRDTPCEAMSCLIAQELVDLEQPAQSTLLTWIERGQQEGNPISSDISRREYEAFYEWIRYSADCHQEVCVDQGLVCQDASPPEEEPEPEGCPPEEHERCAPQEPPAQRTYYGPLAWDCTEEGIQKAFHDVVMPWLGRCGHCHEPEPLIDVGDPPAWMAPGPRLEDSAETFYNLEALGTLDIEDPKRSLFVLKPLARDLGGVRHGGGDKFEEESDPTYRDSLSWLRFYAKCRTAPAQEQRHEPPTDTAQEDP